MTSPIALITLVLAASVGSLSTPQEAPNRNNLRIVVIAGEGAVNVIKQKTAVAPVIEVRDRNNLPVPGAAVTFTIGGNSASFAGGAQTFTVATNAAGQAAAGAVNPLSAGSFQIQVAATYQGQAAAATIAQSNIAAAAAAAGGGISAMTIGIVGAAVGGGAIVATQVAGTSGDEGGPTTYTGSFSGQMVVTLNGNSGQGPYTCTSTRAVTGTLKLELEDQGGTLRGRFEAKADQPEIARTGICGVSSAQPQWASNGDVSTTAANLTFSQTTDTSSGGNRGSHTVAFSGTLSGGVVSGTLSYDSSLTGAGDQGLGFTEKASMTYPVTAR